MEERMAKLEKIEKSEKKEIIYLKKRY